MIDAPSLALAARNIAESIGTPPSGASLVLCSRAKAEIGRQVARALGMQGQEAHLLTLGASRQSGAALKAWIEGLAGQWGLVFLLQPEHAPFLFETVGRPDVGYLLPQAHLFCDWLIRPESLVRAYAIEMDELRQFRRAILRALSKAQEIHIASAGGTDITLYPRRWHATDGEVFTAPVEDRTNGHIWVDGCAYGGPPRAPFLLEVRAGKVVNLDDLGEDGQQRWVYRDLTRDAKACVLAELGIGINPGARWDEDMMESEQARGTCHFGFGHNRAFGGENESSYHLDLIVRHPTIEVDGEAICRAGRYECTDTIANEEEMG